jgi:membrane protein implicated in regulation of membrane protease activity
MPLDRFVLMIVIVIAAAGATIWLGTLLAASMQISGAGWIVMVPVTLVAYVVWRVISDRLRNSEDDHYDRIEK